VTPKSDRLVVAALRADLSAAEAEWDRLDAGDPAAAIRVAIDARIRRLRATVAVHDQTTSRTEEGVA
jgi:hypothetical protein